MFDSHSQLCISYSLLFPQMNLINQDKTLHLFHEGMSTTCQQHKKRSWSHLATLFYDFRPTAPFPSHIKNKHTLTPNHIKIKIIKEDQKNHKISLQGRTCLLHQDIKCGCFFSDKEKFFLWMIDFYPCSYLVKWL